MKAFWKPALAVLALGSLLVVPGCGGDSNGGSIRFVHAISDLGGLDVYLDGRLVAQNVRFRSSSNYFSAKGPASTVALRRTGTSTDYLTRSVSLSGDDELSVVALGSDAGNTESTRVYSDDRSLPEVNNFEVRFIHASGENTAAVDIFLVNPNQDQNSGGVSPIFTNVDFEENTNYRQFGNIGSKRLIVTASGDRSTELFDSEADSFDLGDRVKRTFVLVDGPVPGEMARPVVLADRN